MIAAIPPLPDVILTIAIDRPTDEYPGGYISMTAHEKPKAGVDAALAMEDAADGNHSMQTIEAVVRDLLAYYHTGRKAFANDIRQDEGRGRGR